MRRVLVIGSGGSGKTTVSTRLASLTGLPLTHLDQIYWRAGWVEPAKAEWLQTVQQLIAGEHWILDGNYGGTLGPRLAACDTVVFLDLPRIVCLRNVIARRLKHLRGRRFDVAPGCPERLTWSFLYWIWTYPTRRRSQIIGLLSNLRPDQRAVVLRSRAEVSRFLKTLA